MLNAALTCFSLAALLGIFLLIYILNDKKAPITIALLHGGFAIVGVVLLTIFALEKMNVTWVFVGLFLIIALVGVYLFIQNHIRKIAPKTIALCHGAVAILVLIILVAFSAVKKTEHENQAARILHSINSRL